MPVVVTVSTGFEIGGLMIPKNGVPSHFLTAMPAGAFISILSVVPDDWMTNGIIIFPLLASVLILWTPT